MVEQLFGSKTRVKLLRLFYGNPNRSFYVREITRKIDEQINSVRRELSNLLQAGIITSDTNNNRLYYEVNQKFEFFDPLTTIFGGAHERQVVPKSGSKTKSAVSPGGSIDLSELGNVQLALYTGQFTRDESAGVDLLIVGDINPNKLQKFVTELEAKEGKEIRYAVMSLDDFKYREQIKDRFVSSIRSAKKQVLVDKEQLL
ncbi:MAG TPA: winged helix-turn-helix domain-containing protein [Candidatus Saccharimonadales bacterium]|jgi:hypothetical protein